MATKRLKILIAVMTIILVFMLGFNAWHGEDIVTEMQVKPVVDTGSVASWEVKEIETVIYTWEDTEKEIAEKLNSLIGDYNISYAIIHECSTQTDDYKLCVQNVLGIANAESSMFKAGMKPSNNWFGWMYKWKKRKFSSVEESIKEWVAMYVRNNWGKRVTWKDRLAWKYCTSSCSNWVSAYNSAVRKIEKLELW
jgi:hypothetical protein